MSACNSIEKKLKTELDPSHLEVIDESYLHNVEPGKESHVRVVAVSEKFSQVFRAFQIENEYGRTMETYPTTIQIDGIDRKVDILKVGRIALVYQTPDGAETGMFNPGTRKYESVDNSYQASVRQGIRMARQQASIDMLSLPVVGAGAAQ